MCGILLTWCIGRNNNGPIGADNPVRGENVNTRVVKLQPVNKKNDNNANEEPQERPAEEDAESGAVHGHEVRSLDDAHHSKVGNSDIDAMDTRTPAQRQGQTRAILSDFTNAIVARNI